jgi:hypothetical protein
LVSDVECRFSYIPIEEIEILEELQKPLIIVMPYDCECKQATMAGSIEYDIAVHVVINKKLQNTDTENMTNEICDLIDIEEKIHNAFIKKIKIGTDNFRVIADQPEYLILSDIESIQERNCFLGAVQINAKVFNLMEII